MSEPTAPYHAHVYYSADSRAAAAALRQRLERLRAAGTPGQPLFVGELRDRPVGPHPQAQFEVHFTQAFLPSVLPLLEASGLTTLVHPLTDDDLADHTRLARWLGSPVDLDLSVLDPPGINQGLARFGRSDV